MRKSWKRIVAAGLAAVTMCTSVNLQAFAEDGTILSAEAKWDGVTMTNSYEGDGYTVTYTLSGYWEGGYNASIRIDNVSQEAIHNWYLRVDSEKDLFNIWNGSIYEETETGYVIKNAGWNQDIPKGGYVEFGISGNKNFDGFPEKCELAGGIQQEDAQCYAVNYHLDNDWQFGFTATINIGAKSDRTIEDWILEFDYNREITSVWNAVIESHEGNHYVIRNVGYNADISNGQDVYFGFQGTGGTSLEEPQNYNLYSYAYNNKIVEEKSIVFDVCGDDVSNIPGVQLVCAGEYAQKPENPVREGFYFTGWYTDEDKKELFDFDNTQIEDNITLYAGWLDYTNTTDTDGDGIVDSLEEYIGTDINNVDTDMDGLTDYEELYVVGTNPLAADTDGNGIDDYYDDMDGDGICNGDEIKFGTNPAYIDTDTDGLTDYQEIYEYYTNPDMMDTDNDGASDYWEIQNGFDPLVYNDSFKLIVEPEEVSEAKPVTAGINIEVYEADVQSLDITQVKPHDNYFISPFIAGYLGDAYDFSIDGKFDTAELVFKYDKNLGEIGEEFQPRIYYFNEDLKTFEELENQKVEDGKVTAVTTHFSTYILLNKVEFDKVWENEIKPAANGEDLNIAFVVDLSGSMSGEKLSTTKNVINSFIDALGYRDKAALVSFMETAYVECNLTGDKEKLKKAVGNMATWGRTAIYTGIQSAIHVFEKENPSGYKMMIVFTDGYDEPKVNYGYYDSLAERAKRDGIVINTIGIKTIDEELLTRVAEKTGGNYYYVSQISELQDKVDEIKGDTLDLKKDSNNDGISDYYTQMIEEGKLVLSNSSNELKGINLNYDSEGNLTNDCDGDGLLNGQEIQIVERNGKVYLQMNSHPLRMHSDLDGISDADEVKNGTDPLSCEKPKNNVDYLCKDGAYFFETTADDLKNDEFSKGLLGYAAVINGVFNKEELYRDLMIDYYSTYVTQDVVDAKVFEKERELLYDAYISLAVKANKYVKQPYDAIYSMNKAVSYMSGIRTVKELEEDFVRRTSRIIEEIDKANEEVAEFNFEMKGIPYVKKYMDSDIVKKAVGASQKVLDDCSGGISFLVYGQDIMDTVYNLSKIEANKSVFNENMDVLEYISKSASDKNIRAAAKNVQDILAERYLEVYCEEMKKDIGESLGDWLIYFAVTKISYVAVVVAARDVMSLSIGSKDDVEQMYKILCYSEMCDAYINALFKVIDEEENGKYYVCEKRENLIDVMRYMENLAQLRVLGEKEYYAYIEKTGLIGGIVNAFNNIEQLKIDINNSIWDIKKCANRLGLRLSNKISYEVE